MANAYVGSVLSTVNHARGLTPNGRRACWPDLDQQRLERFDPQVQIRRDRLMVVAVLVPVIVIACAHL